jgi:succinoglycan biosynthesis protein ExoA
MEEELVSVVVPCRNEQLHIGPCLDSILAQNEANLQVIVVDSSDDGTPEVISEYARKDPRVELLMNSRGSIPEALNAGLAAARGRWLVRVDAHSTVPPNYVTEAVKLLRSGDWGGVGGRKEAIGVTPAGHAIAAALSSPFGVGDSMYHYGTMPKEVDHVPFGAYPVALVRELGGWDETILTNEDYEFDYRLRQRGHKLLFDPGLTIGWQCRQSVAELFRQYRRYGRGKASVVRLHPRSVRLRHLAPPALTTVLVCAAVVGLRRPRIALWSLLPYASVITLGTATAAGKTEDRGGLAFLPVVFPTMHTAWGLGFWEGLIRGNITTRAI